VVEQDIVDEIVETLEMLLDDMALKPKIRLNEIIENLKGSLDLEKVLKIQDDLEHFSNTANIDSYTRNEIMNVLSLFDNLI